MPLTWRSSSISTYSSSVTPPGVWVHSTGVYPGWASADSMIWAKAGKIGLSSSGTTSPTRPALRLPQPGRAFVAEHVERGEHRLAGLGGTPGLSLSTRRDGRLADAGLGGDVGQGAPWRNLVTQTLQRSCKVFHFLQSC